MKHKRRFKLWISTVLLLLLAVNAGAQGPEPQAALGSGFTYQGRLLDGDDPAEGRYDLRFILYDADAGGAQVGRTVRVQDVPVSDIAAFVRSAPHTTIVLNGCKTTHAAELLASNTSLDQVYMDVNAMDQDFEGLQALVAQFGLERLVYGSQMPFLYPEAALIVVEHAGLEDVDVEAILAYNWRTSPVLVARCTGGNSQ